MFRIISGDDLSGLLESLHGQAGRKSLEGAVSGDVAILAERAKERRTPKPFDAGQFVQFRAPDGLGMHWTHGHFIVIRMLDKPILAENAKDSWENMIFAHAEADMVVGFMMEGPGGQRIYREQLTWSGFFVPYVLTEMEVEMEKIGLREAEKVQRKDPEESHEDAAAIAQPASKEPNTRSRWGSPE